MCAYIYITQAVHSHSRSSPLSLSRERGVSSSSGVGAAGAKTNLFGGSKIRECCLLVLNSVNSTPQWIRQPELRDMHDGSGSSSEEDAWLAC